MAEVMCAGCRQKVDESDTFFGTMGTICARCHADEEAYDDWNFSGPEYEDQPRPAAAIAHENRLAGYRPSRNKNPPKRKKTTSPTRCTRCGDEFGDAGPYHATDGNGFHCVVCAHT